MKLLTLSLKSLRNRRFTSALTVCSIALSVALLFGIEKLRVSARESFANTISQTDLIVGARSGSIQLLLYSVFRLGNATNNVSYKTFEKFKNHPATSWAIPYSLGDSHKGFRVVGTDSSFYEHYRYHGDQSVRFQEGAQAKELFDVVLGSDVASHLRYTLNDPIVIAHGISDGPALLEHKNKPFHIVGILTPTGTPIDRSIYITLEGMEAIHLDWADGGPPLPGAGIDAEDLKKREIAIDQITSFFLQLKSKIDILYVQREINMYEDEPLLAIMPGVALSELWSNINYAEAALKTISGFVVVVGLLGMLIAIYSSLNERRREMAILRAIGMGVRSVAFLLVSEAFLLAFMGVSLGVVTTYFGLWAGESVIQRLTGLYMPAGQPTLVEWIYVGVLLVSSLLLGIIPAYKAYRNSLVDGLSIRT